VIFAKKKKRRRQLFEKKDVLFTLVIIDPVKLVPKYFYSQIPNKVHYSL